jgi:hypothetical protein
MNTGYGGTAMNRHESSGPEKAVRLYEDQGKTSRLIDAEIRDDGDLVVSGYDVGQAPRQWFGHSDYEFRVTLEAGQKDRLLLALIEKCFGGRFSAVEEFREFVRTKKIPVNWKTW